MNIIFLSPHFPAHHHLFCLRLREAGLNVLGIDQIPYESLSSEVRASLNDYYQVNDLHHYEELVQAYRYFIAKHGSIHRLESHSEYWLQTQADLSTEFGIHGLKIDTMEQIKKKSHMKKVFRGMGLSPADGDLVLHINAALMLSQKLGYPLMLKPDVGVGASGCHKVHHETELIEFFHRKPSHEYLMEEFIEGDVCSFDGLVDRHGRLLFHSSCLYGAGIAEVIRHQLDQVFYTLRDIPEDLEEIGRKTLSAFDVKERFFHFEYFRTHKEGKLIPIEVNIRPPGAPTLDMFNYASDIDLYKLWAGAISGQVDHFSYDRKYHCMSLSRRHRNHYKHTHQQVLDHGKELILHHGPVPPINTATMGDYYYVARSQQLYELADLQAYIQENVLHISD